VNATARRLIDSAAARVICARLVRETPAFFAREIVRPGGIRIYHARENGVSVAIRHRSVDAATLAEVFYHHWYHPPEEVARALGSPREILDLGANIGLFGALAVTMWPEARIVGYEPDPGNAEVHDAAIAANGLGDRWSVSHAAAGVADGEVRLAAGRGPSSFVLAEGAAVEHEVVVAMRDVMGAIAGADLLKMDIEGGEWPILTDARFAAAPPRVVVLEYHRVAEWTLEPHAQAVALLGAAGMRTQTIWDAERDGYGMLWAWRD
jgi:FkbM family methyltransferase